MTIEPRRTDGCVCQCHGDFDQSADVCAHCWPPMPPHSAATTFPLTPRAQKILDLAGEAAAEYGEDFIGTEHLLLGMMREGEAVAWGIVSSLVGEGKIEMAVDHMIRSRQAESA